MKNNLHTPVEISILFSYLLALLLIAMSLKSWSGEFDAFGPEHLVRGSNQPTEQVFTFAVSNTDIPYTLQLNNGGANGDFKQVSSAVVSLNGVRVFGPKQFNQTVAELELPVYLKTQNQLSVKLQSKPGAGVTLRIIGEDNDPPMITAELSSPANAAGWHNSDTTVSFICSDSTSGIASCSEPVLVDTEGAGQTITGEAVDRAGNTATISVTINLDKTAPAFSEFLPADGDTVPEPELNLAGLVTEALSGFQSVTCDTNSTLVDAALIDGQNADEKVMSCSLPLDVGANLVRVLATDEAGNEGSAPLTIYHVLPPNITITSPEDGALQLSTPITVTGTVDDGNAMVTVNNIPAAVSNGTYAAQVPLQNGVFEITATATNVAGADSESVSVLALLGPIPAIQIDTPGDGFVLGGYEGGRAVTVTVSGWVRDNRPVPVGQPIVTVWYNNQSVNATVTNETSGLCRSINRCWTYTADQSFIPPDGVEVSITVEAQTGDQSASRGILGLVDFCYGNDGDSRNNATSCGPSLYQDGTRQQSRRCIGEANGCSNPFSSIMDVNDPTGGELGLASTTFGLSEEETPEGAPTVFGQRRPIQLPCNRHDECFLQWCPAVQSRAGVRQEQQLFCNKRFLEDMKAVCQRAYPESTCPSSRIGLRKCPAWRAEKSACYAWSYSYYKSVNLWSNTFLTDLPYQDAPYKGYLNMCQGCPAVDDKGGLIVP